MRIGLIINQLKNAGGAYQLLQLAQQLRKKGHTIIIYTITSDVIDISPDLLQGLTIKSCNTSPRVEKIPHGQLIGFLLYVSFHIKTTLMLAKLMYADSLDLLNPHEWPAQWSAVLIKWLKGTPIVWICNDIWHIPGNEEYPENRIVFSVGNKIIIGLLDKLLTSYVNAIIVLDHRIQSIIKTYYQKQSVVVRSGIDLNMFKTVIPKINARDELNLSRNLYIFLCFHAFFRHRRFEDVVYATSTLRHSIGYKNFLVYIVGSDKFDPEYATLIKTLIEKEQLEQIIKLRTEYVPTEKVKKYFFACDAFIFPNDKQTWGIAAIEAMAAGKPCIISKGAGVHEVIKDGVNGLMFTPRDTKELSKKMNYLLEHPKEAELIGKRAKNYVFKNFSWTSFAIEIEKNFNDVLKRQAELFPLN
ncbi:MAG: glycosyltransferase family 4 protein [Patescibacteria group bacterium]|nr:glycosyltransferase family 4 protein [Patescibacteria group bacterium]MDE2590008.1 glycosyltransferase family 4 protein [Patescibacteria group bacterium]